MSEQKTQIVVIGAGYAGLLCTVRLAGKTRRQNVQITLVNAVDTFIERVRLHQYAANQPVKYRPIRATLRGTGVAFVEGVATAIDARRRTVAVQTSTGSQSLTYDYLVYALGSTMDRGAVPGVREHTYALTPRGPQSAEALRTVLPLLDKTRGRLVVVGGGATGIEAAAEFADAYRNLQVSLVTRGELAAHFGGKIQAHIVKTLQRLGVSIQERTTIARVEAHTLITADNAAIPFDVCLWAGGFSVPTLARDAGLAVNERNQLQIDPYMRSISHPEIYGAGDCAHPVEDPSVPVRMAAVTAAMLGAHAADCLSNALQGRPQKPLSFAYLGQGIALGRHDAVGFNNYPDDKPKGPVFTGNAAAQIRDVFVRFLANAANFERRWPGFFFWLGKNRVKEQLPLYAQRYAQPVVLATSSRRRESRRA